MFKRILVALDHSKADEALLPQVRGLARLTRASLLLLHVSTGWAAQWQKELNLSDSKEMQEDRDYLERVSWELRAEGFNVETVHASGRPPEEILKVARTKNCDLIAANDVSRADCGMESDDNEVTVLFRNGERQKISRAPKKIIARELVKIFTNMREKCLTKKM